MMLGAQQTITIWNKYKNPIDKKHQWFRHIISNCSWETDIITSLAGSTASIANKYTVLINENDNYRTSKDWKTLGADEKTIYFTFNSGDLAALGAYQIEITGTSPYTESETKTELLPHAFTISIVNEELEAYKHGRHIEISGV